MRSTVKYIDKRRKKWESFSRIDKNETLTEFSKGYV